MAVLRPTAAYFLFYQYTDATPLVDGSDDTAYQINSRGPRTKLGAALEAYSGGPVTGDAIVHARLSATRSNGGPTISVEFELFNPRIGPNGTSGGGPYTYWGSTPYFTVPTDGVPRDYARPVSILNNAGNLDAGMRGTPGIELYFDPDDADALRVLNVIELWLELPTAVAVSDDWLRAVQRSDGQGAGGPPRGVQQATSADSLRAGTAVT